jgi:flagellin FlaB
MVEITTPRQPDTDRGQVGIETLIIFIAMILVAAVAAGVLINTAGFLQNKASSTSQDSQEQVSNQVIVVSAIGTVDVDTVNRTNLTVMMSPGADEIDLAAATIEYIGPAGHSTLTHNGTTLADAGPDNETFATTTINGEDPTVLTEKQERIVVMVDMSGSSSPLQPLNEGDEATFRIVTQSGSQYTYIANVPESLTSKDSGEAVEL